MRIASELAPLAIFAILHMPSAQTGDGLDRRIGALGEKHLQLGSAWLVQSRETADELRDFLCEELPADDTVLVFQVGDQAAWRALGEKQAEWLLGHVGLTEDGSHRL